MLMINTFFIVVIIIFKICNGSTSRMLNWFLDVRLIGFVHIFFK